MPGFFMRHVCVYVCTYVCVYVCTPPSPLITSGVILTLCDWLNNLCCFSVLFIALQVNVIDRRGPSNEMHHQLQPKKTKIRLYFWFI